eukprot:CAMPEP_0202878256 /NCGR_PEP_ID=MMETSP1391-20130828/31920_1 /ASSEMBLY_ACC=CAM_ASM_000867 /TAXON_ID=1034604 /ORGANISM="Chlamydomonas leiostraca, Strain SAG 11-49" /LENGTH=204 /DNA_ID=CAMNT_0049560419 /DNA_START=160 /DNA_END=771 /DNA_ORIENTATION=-
MESFMQLLCKFQSLAEAQVVNCPLSYACCCVLVRLPDQHPPTQLSPDCSSNRRLGNPKELEEWWLFMGVMGESWVLRSDTWVLSCKWMVAGEGRSRPLASAEVGGRTWLADHCCAKVEHLRSQEGEGLPARVQLVHAPCGGRVSWWRAAERMCSLRGRWEPPGPCRPPACVQAESRALTTHQCMGMALDDEGRSWTGDVSGMCT